MPIQVDLNSQVPIYQQIRTSIIKAISTGEIKSGDALPSVRQMAVDIGVNMHTVNKAYSLLRFDGYIIINRRSGAIVGNNTSADNGTIMRISSLINQAAIEAIGKNMSQDDFMSLCDQAYEEIKNNKGELK